MFTPTSVEKSCLINSVENSLSGRNNISSRYPLGMPSTWSGDENQQIRIQLAVHKYNSLSSPSRSNKRGLVSPSRPCFFKNTPKGRPSEENGESKVKNEKSHKCFYDAVGEFPTVHLKKNSVLYRPIRRFNEVKIPYPDLPVNRFLSQLPEFSSHLKNNTRSVLEVLQDLSKKKNTPKEETQGNQVKSRGLAGDFDEGVDAVYRPLFVPKLKVVNTSTKDNATQTFKKHKKAPILNKSFKKIFSRLCDSVTAQKKQSVKKNLKPDRLSHCYGSSDSQNSILGASGDADPKAELRRKLARQNNEIFASLSSSIISSFPSKRKIDEVIPSKDNEYSNDGTVIKKPKIFVQHTCSSEEKGFSSAVGVADSNDQLIKINRKSKLNELSPTSPNKDRLTTIYLDMQNTSSKAEIFEKNSGLEETKSSAILSEASRGSSNIPNGIGKNVKESVDNSSVEKSILANSEESISQKRSSLNVFLSSSGPGDSSLEFEESKEKVKNSVAPSFSESKSNGSVSRGDVLKSSSGQCGIESWAVKIQGSNDTEKMLAPPAVMVNKTQKGSEKNELKNEVFSTTYSKETESNSFKANSFKFENKENSTRTTHNKPIKNSVDHKPQTSNEFPKSTSLEKVEKEILIDSEVLNKTTLHPTEAKMSEASPTIQAQASPQILLDKNIFPLKKNDVQTTISDSAKPLYAFGNDSFSFCPNRGNEKSNITSSFLGQRSQPLFNFGQKSEECKYLKLEGKEEEKNANAEQAVAVSPNENLVPNQPGFLFPNASNTSNNTGIADPISKDKNISLPSNSEKRRNDVENGGTGPAFTIENKATVLPVFSSSSTSSSVTASQPAFSFAYDQKSEIGGSGSEISSPANLFGRKNSTGLFNFGHKTSQKSLMTPEASTEASLLKTKSSESSSKSPLFGQNSLLISASSPNSNQQTNFHPDSNLATNFGSKAQTTTFNQFSASSAFSPNNSLFPPKTSSFGNSTTSQSAAIFGSLPSSNSFQVPVSSQSNVAFGTCTTAQSASGFGTPSSAQTGSCFGGSVFTQANNGFGNPSTTSSGAGFATPATTQSSTPLGFGIANSSQSSPNFGGSPPTRPVPLFGVNSSQNFGQNSEKSHNNLGQSQSIFGQPVSQSPAPGAGFAPPAANFSASGPQSSIFGKKVDGSPAGAFEQNKIQPSFGQNITPQSFGTPTKFSFGMSSSSPAEFAGSQPSTTTASVFNFGANAPGQPAPTFGFGGSSSSSTSSNPQGPFAFKSPSTEAFKFGTSSPKEGSGFGNGSNSGFGFGAHANNNATEAKPAGSGFNFGVSQSPSSATGFNFGPTPSPSVFSFGGTGSGSSSTGSGFNFGAAQAGSPLGQPSTSSPANFSAPGTFSIGWGSSQSRPRAASRLRRRP